MLTFVVRPAHSLHLPDYTSERRDGLWRSTCFELFTKPQTSPQYREFNFAPVAAWNVYSFTDWRRGMAVVDLSEAPHLVDARLDDRQSEFPSRYELDIVLPLDFAPKDHAKVSLTAVIEEADGIKSYWALAHPPGEPNFHHPACFIAELPPPARP